MRRLVIWEADGRWKMEENGAIHSEEGVMRPVASSPCVYTCDSFVFFFQHQTFILDQRGQLKEKWD